MFGGDAFGEGPFGGFNTETLALTSGILSEVLTGLVDQKKLPSLPNRLHHFTSLEVASLVFMHDNVRLSHAEYSNDQTEMAQAKSVIADELKTKAGDAFFDKVASEFELRAPDLDAYIFCMCTDGSQPGQVQDILGQWRAYGQDGRGACLSLDASHLSRLVNNTPGLRINPIIYENNIQRQFIDEILTRGRAAYAAGEPSALEATLAALVFATPLMKVEGFKEEREWRLIFMPPKDAPQLRLGFQPRRDFLAPHIDLGHVWNDLRPQMVAISSLRDTLPTIMPTVSIPPLVPVTEVMVGPSGHQPLNVRALKKLLNQVGRGTVPISFSRIPYRSLN